MSWNSLRGQGAEVRQKGREEEDEDENSHDVTISKWPRLQLDEQNIKEASWLTTPPDLLDLVTSSDESQLLFPDAGDVNRDGGICEANRMATLRRHALLAQHKLCAHFTYCDQNAARKAVAACLEGPRGFGGAYLCLKCRGAEYLADYV